MRTSLLVILLILQGLFSSAQTDTISHRVFLIGDAGELLGSKQPVIDWINKHVIVDDERNTFIFLGDNIYPRGLPMEGEANYAEYKRILDHQINLVKGTKAKSFFVMGNHDWKGGKMGGWQQVLNQINYINGLGESNIQAWPREGCPGPVPIELNDKVVAVFIDSQWFLYVHDKPGPGSTCPAKTVDEFATELNEIAAMHPNQLMILAMHHPMYSFGVHGGDYTWKEHLFPFTAVNPNLWIPMPVIGSIYPIARGVFGNLQDIPHPLYKNMVNVIENAMKRHPNPLHAAGHDHSLQMIINNDLPFIVSGSAINLTRATKRNRKGELLFADVTTQGFVMVEVRNSGKVEAKFYNISSTDISRPIFVHQLDSIKVIPPVLSKDSIPNLPDSITVAANPELAAGGLKKFLMGKNYREEWKTPIKVPVLDLGKEQGGLLPEKQGGGKQTRSLRVEDKNGKEWVLRSIRKYPEAAIPADLRSQFAIDVVEDGISASFPFAALSVNPMASAAGVPTLRRKLVYIPDDPRLGRFRNTFKNTLAMLEEREPANVDKTYNTDELILRLAKDNDDHVDQLQVLKARILDNFYMDFDRHEDQWRWATRDTGKGKIYYPIPRDQDQAFYTNEGVIPYFVKKPWLVPELQGFETKADNIKTFNRPARNFDRFFLNELGEEVWDRQLDSFISRMTDDVITTSLYQQPQEIRGIHTEKMINTLMKRRGELKKDMIEYYRFISRRVNVVGTNQRELFLVERTGNGKVHVTLHKIDKENQISSKIYDRVFDPSVTKELILYGLADADSFVFKGEIPIKMRVVGGPGEDHFKNENAGGRIRVYDVSYEANAFSGNHNEFIKNISSDPKNNMYNRLFYRYNIFHPGLSFAYNRDDGLFLGAKFQYIRHGFRKEPYAMRHTLSGGHALNTSSWYFRYLGEITQAIGRNDLVLSADIKAPVNVTNFFGYGNFTTFNKEIGIPYYRVRYNIINASALIRKQMQSWMRISYGPTFQTFRLDEEQNKDRFINDPSVNGLDPATLYSRKSYAGAEFVLDINSRNNQVLPSRGLLLDAGVKQLYGINGESRNLTQLRWDMSIIASFVPQAKFIFATRLGWYHNIGHFEFPQANYLGGTTNLRGFRRDRFAGRTTLFNNTEVRMKLGNFTTYLFPGSIGLLAFHDIGRVYVDHEEDKKWHNGYGGGIWIAPIQRFVITASVARSTEGTLPYITFGFQF